jgi:hypothetical protein
MTGKDWKVTKLHGRWHDEAECEKESVLDEKDNLGIHTKTKEKRACN